MGISGVVWAYSAHCDSLMYPGIWQAASILVHVPTLYCADLHVPRAGVCWFAASVSRR